MTTLYLDFETKDFGIAQSLGAGWPYANKVKVIGFAFSFDDRPVQWRSGVEDLDTLIECADIIVCHNTLYDIGILRMLGIEYENKLIVDTLILAKLHDNRLRAYNLDALANHYFKDSKADDKFEAIAWDLGLVKSKSQNAIKYAKENLDIVYAKYPEVVTEYAKQDVELTRKLYKLFTNTIESEDYKFYSDLIKSLIDSRARGVRIDVQRIYTSKAIIDKKLFSTRQELEKFLLGRNPNSTVQLAEICDELGVSYPVTDKLNPSITSAWIENQSGPFFETLNLYKKLNKLKNDFIDKTISLISGIEGISIDEVESLQYSRIHPEINIFGATATGRFSGSNLNVQQQPKRDEFSRPLVRSMFVPEEGHSWYCLDFSAQEPRLQVHYAAMIGSENGKEMAEDWRLNPDYDMHEMVASMCGISRKEAKTINLGLAYGMGVGKLARSLKLSDKQARALLAAYHSASPYMKELTEAAKRNILKNNYIKTILGRKLYKDFTTKDDDGREQDFSYKAINKLIQGSAADQTMAAMVLAYRHGISVLFPVHDELTISSPSTLEVCKLKYIMENAIQLLVPSKSEVTGGPDFADQTPTILELSDQDKLEYDKFVSMFVPIR